MSTCSAAAGGGQPTVRGGLEQSLTPTPCLPLAVALPVCTLARHALLDDARGRYRYVRHPSYLGAMLAFVGWALVFRSSVGLLATVLGLRLLMERIASEEALLASQFGSAYDKYRASTWRLLPGIY